MYTNTDIFNFFYLNNFSSLCNKSTRLDTLTIYKFTTSFSSGFIKLTELEYVLVEVGSTTDNGFVLDYITSHIWDS